MRMYFADGSEFDSPVSALEGYRVTYHFDDAGGEWIVRIHHPKGMVSVCGCPGESEAKVVASSIAAVVAIADCTFTKTIAGNGEFPEVSCNNVIEYDAMEDAASQAIALVKGLTE